MIRLLFSSALLIFVLTSCHHKEDLLHSGPMVGYSEMREAIVWLQTKEPATVCMNYWLRDSIHQKYHTPEVHTCEKRIYTAKLIANMVEPGNIYDYEIIINGHPVEIQYETSFQTLPLWQWRTNPPDFSFAAGSGAYINEEKYDRPGKPYGGEYNIYNSILDKKPDFMIWLGDNLYFREPDWNSWTGIIKRHTHDRSIPELQPLLGSVHHYSIWDDHDYGPDDSDRGFWNKKMTLEAYKLFWANPSFGTGNIKGVITFFQWGDADFFMLDNRYYRSPNDLIGDDKSMLGKEQLQWLFDGLVSSHANFKIVVMGGQFLNTAGVYETYTNHGFEGERQRIIDFIYDQEIEGVYFLTGDRHHTELSKLEEEGKPVIYDLTFSPLNSGVNIYAGEETNDLRVDGTLVMKRNFGLVSFSGPKDQRKMKIEVFDSEGALQWRKVLD